MGDVETLIQKLAFQKEGSKSARTTDNEKISEAETEINDEIKSRPVLNKLKINKSESFIDITIPKTIRHGPMNYFDLVKKYQKTP